MNGRVVAQATLDAMRRAVYCVTPTGDSDGFTQAQHQQHDKNRAATGSAQPHQPRFPGRNSNSASLRNDNSASFHVAALLLHDRRGVRPRPRRLVLSTQVVRPGRMAIQADGTLAYQFSLLTCKYLRMAIQADGTLTPVKLTYL